MQALLEHLRPGDKAIRQPPTLYGPSTTAGARVCGRVTGEFGGRNIGLVRNCIQAHGLRSRRRVDFLHTAYLPDFIRVNDRELTRPGGRNYVTGSRIEKTPHRNRHLWAHSGGPCRFGYPRP